MIDEKLGELAVEFWDMTWKSEKRYLDYNIRLLLSLANAVGAGRDAAGHAGTAESLCQWPGLQSPGRRIRTAGLEYGHRLLQF